MTDTQLARIELQKIDCNCSDCIFMQRDLDRFKFSLDTHHKWQLDYYNLMREKMLKKADEWEKKGDLKKAKFIRSEVAKKTFQFDKSTCSINYGNCTKFNKAVSFIPNTCQLDTQTCFKHRRES